MIGWIRRLLLRAVGMEPAACWDLPFEACVVYEDDWRADAPDAYPLYRRRRL